MTLSRRKTDKHITTEEVFELTWPYIEQIIAGKRSERFMAIRGSIDVVLYIGIASIEEDNGRIRTLLGSALVAVDNIIVGTCSFSWDEEEESLVFPLEFDK